MKKSSSITKKGNIFLRLSFIVPIVIICLGIALRAPEIINRNYLFGYDQGWNMEMVKDIVDGRNFRLIGAEASSGSGFSGIFHGPGFYYLSGIFYILFHGDPYGGLVFMFTCGVLTLLVSYFWLRKQFGKRHAALGLLFLSIGPQLVSESRFVWGPHPIPLLMVLILIVVTNMMKNPAVYLPLAVFLSGLIYHFHLAIAVPVVLSIFLYAVFFMQIKSVSVYVKSIGALLLAIFPALLFEIRHGFMAFRGIMKYLSDYFNPVTIQADAHVYSLGSHVQDYWNNLINSFPFYGVFRILSVQIVVIILFSYGVYIGLRYNKNIQESGFIKFLLLLTAITLLMFLFINNTIWDYYLVSLHIVYPLLVVFAILSLQRHLVGSVKYLIMTLVFFVLGNFIIGSFVSLYRLYTVDLYDYGGTQKIKGKLAALDYLYKDANGQPFSVMVFTPPVYTYAYDYLFGWYGKNTYGYVPIVGKSSFTYLLIEVDSEKPWSYNGWLDTVVKDGEIIDTMTLPNGFIVQKRIFP